VKWAFERLGLPMDADAASIKRAYARLLRDARPDDDPDAFQRLHAAYKAALAFAEKPTVLHPNAPDSAAPTSEPTQPSTTFAKPASAAPTGVTVELTRPTVDIHALANEVVRIAADTDDSQSVSQWLQARSEFWSLAIKQQAGSQVLQRLFRNPQAVAPQCMDALLHFFDLDHVLSGVNPFALQQLRHRQRAMWEIIPRNHAELAQRMGHMWGQRPETVTLGQDIALLQQPFSWLRALRAALQIGRGRELARLVQALSNNGRLDQLPPSIDRQHAQFWLSAAVAGGPMTAQRFAIGSLLAGIAAVGSALLVFGVLLISNASPSPQQASLRYGWPTLAAYGSTAGKANRNPVPRAGHGCDVLRYLRSAHSATRYRKWTPCITSNGQPSGFACSLLADFAGEPGQKANLHCRSAT
jgi:hypothetical protein